MNDELMTKVNTIIEEAKSKVINVISLFLCKKGGKYELGQYMGIRDEGEVIIPTLVSIEDDNVYVTYHEEAFEEKIEKIRIEELSLEDIHTLAFIIEEELNSVK